MEIYGWETAAGALPVWENERNEMTTGEGRGVSFVYVLCRGDCVTLGEKDRRSGRGLARVEEGERERDRGVRYGHGTTKNDKNKRNFVTPVVSQDFLHLTRCILYSGKSLSVTSSPL